MYLRPRVFRCAKIEKHTLRIQAKGRAIPRDRALCRAYFIFMKNTRDNTHSFRAEDGQWRSMSRTNVTGPIFKSSSLASLLFVSCFRAIRRWGTYVARVSVPLSRLSSRALHLPRAFPPNGRTDRRTIPRTFVERQKERNEARAKRVANRAGKSKRDKTARSREKRGEGREKDSIPRPSNPSGTTIRAPTRTLDFIF